MIKINALKKSFGQSTILNDVTLRIRRGEIFGLVGRSGAGKSTLLRCITGLEQYDGGTIHVNNVEVGSLEKKELLRFRQGVGMIFQDFALLQRKSVLENVCLPMECWRVEKKAARERATQLLSRVGLSDKINAMPFELSGGQKQRVAIARALTLNPSILLCDEATSALDPDNTRSILALLRSLNQELGITIVVVSHEMKVIKEICDSVAILENGTVTADGAVQDVFLNNNAALRKFLQRTEITAAQDQKIVALCLTEQSDEQELLYRIAADMGIRYSVLSAEMDVFQGKQINIIHLSVCTRDVPPLQACLQEQGVKIWGDCP